MLRSVVTLALLASCSSSSPPPPAPPPGSGSSAGSGSSTDSGAGSSACVADATHCCQPDGTLIEPTCSPVIRKPTDSFTRAPDGTCAPCPLRCLPAAARIRTPRGDVPIDHLHVGDLVMTADLRGRAVAAPILELHATPRTGAHELVVVTLADGRTVRGSAAHPTADGATLGALRVGGVLDGAMITALEREPFTGVATWDLLPAGATGTYWADGVLLGSTLR